MRADELLRELVAAADHDRKSPNAPKRNNRLRAAWNAARAYVKEPTDREREIESAEIDELLAVRHEEYRARYKFLEVKGLVNEARTAMRSAYLNEKPHEQPTDNGFRMALNIRPLPASPPHAAAEPEKPMKPCDNLNTTCDDYPACVCGRAWRNNAGPREATLIDRLRSWKQGAKTDPPGMERVFWEDDAEEAANVLALYASPSAQPIAPQAPHLTADMATAAECIDWLRNHAKSGLGKSVTERCYLCANIIAEAYGPAVDAALKSAGKE